MVGNFGNFFALAFLYLLALNLPLLPVQLLLTSLLTDVPLITIAWDTLNREEMLRPERDDARSLMFIAMTLGSVTAFFELLFFALLNTRPPQFVQTSLFLYLTFVQLIVIVSIRNRDHFWRGKRPSWLLAIASVLTFIVSLALPYLTLFENLFHFTPLPLGELTIILALVVVYVVVLDVVKVWYYRIVEREVSKSSPFL